MDSRLAPWIDGACRRARAATKSQARRSAITALGDIAVADEADDLVDQRTDMVDAIIAFGEGRIRYATLTKTAAVYLCDLHNAGRLPLDDLTMTTMMLAA